jgi:hypothetical protein
VAVKKKPANGHANRQQQLVNHFRNSNCGSIKPAGNYDFPPFHRYPQEIKYPELYYQTEDIQVLRESGWLVSGPGFESWTCQIRSRTATFCLFQDRGVFPSSIQANEVMYLNLDHFRFRHILSN